MVFVAVITVVVVLAFVLPGILALSQSVVWYLTSIWKKFCRYCFKYIFCSIVPFFSFWYSHHAYDAHFVVVPQSLNILFWYFFFSPLSLLFSWGGFYRDILKLRYHFFTDMQSTNNSIEGILHCAYSVFDLWQLLLVSRISISLLTLHIYSCIVISSTHWSPYHINHSCFKLPVW